MSVFRWAPTRRSGRDASASSAASPSPRIQGARRMSTRTSKKASAPAAARVAAPKPRLQERYEQDVMPALQKEFAYDNVMRTPALHKIVINIGMGEAIQNPKTKEAAERDL